ncbi:MAG: hypothetical protein HY271_04965 [Deltaproteobacteria bacterium]|nr:hypothetical protein [Deltaproteobacteria bacterium]
MRIMIVAVTALLCAATVASAEESGNRSDALFCTERCDKGYETCMRWRTGKGTQDCPGNLFRCRNTCETPAERAAAKLARPALSCRDACQANFDTCLRADDGKHGQACAKSVMVCRNGCPAEPSEPAAESAAPANPVTETRTVPPPPASDANAPEPARAVAPPVGDEPRSATSSAAMAPATGETATHDAATPPRTSAWSRAWCAVTGSCGSRAAARRPVSCDDACGQAYDACIAREDPKRGGECATASVRCRTGCADRKAPQ